MPLEYFMQQDDAAADEAQDVVSGVPTQVLTLHQRCWWALLQRMRRDGVKMTTYTGETQTLYKFYTAEKKVSCVQHVDFVKRETRTLFTTNDVCKLDNFSKFSPGGGRAITVENLTFCAGKLALEWVGMRMYAEKEGVRDEIHKYAVDALEADLQREEEREKLLVDGGAAAKKVEAAQASVARLRGELERIGRHAAEARSVVEVFQSELRAKGGRMFLDVAKAIRKQLDGELGDSDRDKWAKHLALVERAQGAFEQAVARDGCTAEELVEAVRRYRWEALQPVLLDLRPGAAKIQVGRNVLYYFVRFAWEGLEVGSWTVTVARKHLMLLEPDVAYLTHAMTHAGRAAEYSFTDEIWALKPPDYDEVAQEPEGRSSLETVDPVTWPLYAEQLDGTPPRKLEVANTRAVDWLNLWGMSLRQLGVGGEDVSSSVAPQLGVPPGAKWLEASGWEQWLRAAVPGPAGAPYEQNRELMLLLKTTTFEMMAAMLIFFGEQWDAR